MQSPFGGSSSDYPSLSNGTDIEYNFPCGDTNSNPPSPESDVSSVTGQDGSQSTGVTPKGLPAACVFISAINPITTEERVKEHMEEHYGTVLRCAVRWEGAQTKPHAFVQFLRLDSANAAISDSGKQALDSQVLTVARAKVNSTLFVAKVPKSINNNALRQICETLGEVERVALMTDTVTLESRGCGFVKYKYREDAAAARNILRERYPTWVVDWAKSTREEDKGDIDRSAVWIGGLDKHRVTEELIQQRFSAYDVS